MPVVYEKVAHAAMQKMHGCYAFSIVVFGCGCGIVTHKSCEKRTIHYGRNKTNQIAVGTAIGDRKHYCHA